MEVESEEIGILLDSEQELINEISSAPSIETEEEVVTETVESSEEVGTETFESTEVGIETVESTEVGTETVESTEENSGNVSKFDIHPSVTSKVEPNSDKYKHRKPGRPLDKSYTKKEESTRYRPLHLPLARVKQIIKMDPDVHLAGSDAVFLIAKATELFIELLSKDAYAFTASSKKKTIQKKDVDSAIANTDTLIFLDGALDF